MSRLRHVVVSIASLSVTLALASPVSAVETLPPTPESQLFYTNLTVFRLNPLGLQNQFELDYRHRLYDPGDSILLAQNYAGFGIAPTFTPGLMRLGVTAKVQPLAILKLEAKWEYLSYFGNFNFIQSFADTTGDYSDTGIEAGGDAGRNFAADGWQLTLDAEVRARVGPVIVRNRFKANYQEVALKTDDPLYHEPYNDLLLTREGWYFTNDLDLLVQVNPNLIIGVRHAMLATSYPASAYPGGVAVDDDNSPVHRLGPLIAYTFFDEPGESFNRPTILVLANWYLQHRFRAGQDVSQAFPYLVVGFAFSGDLVDWRSNR